MSSPTVSNRFSELPPGEEPPPTADGKGGHQPAGQLSHAKEEPLMSRFSTIGAGQSNPTGIVKAAMPANQAKPSSRKHFLPSIMRNLYFPSLPEAVKAMRKAVVPTERRPAPAGWVVKVQAHYYTGSTRSEFERWTPFLKFAKRYRRAAWAKKIAEQLGGQAELVGQAAADG